MLCVLIKIALKEYKWIWLFVHFINNVVWSTYWLDGWRTCTRVRVRACVCVYKWPILNYYFHVFEVIGLLSYRGGNHKPRVIWGFAWIKTHTDKFNITMSMLIWFFTVRACEKAHFSEMCVIYRYIPGTTAHLTFDTTSAKTSSTSTVILWATSSWIPSRESKYSVMLSKNHLAFSFDL